jgi:hypothetical protein
MNKGVLKKVVRDPSYGVPIRSRSEEEMVETAVVQAEQSHRADLVIKDVRALVQDAKNG